MERRAYGFKSKKQLDHYMASLTSYRPTSSAFLTDSRLEYLRAKGWSDAKIANQHKLVFGRQSPISIKTMVSTDKWLRRKETKKWYVEVLGKYTSREYDEKYGIVR